MRFAVLAAALVGVVAAGKEYAQSTTYVTEEITITSCAPTVTNCPARSTLTSTTVYAVTSSSSSSVPVVYQNTTSTPPAATKSHKVSPPGGSTETVYVTVSACPATTTAPAAVVVPPASTASSVASHTPIPAKNSTTTGVTPFTGGAAQIGGSLALAGLAGLAVVVLA